MDYKTLTDITTQAALQFGANMLGLGCAIGLLVGACSVWSVGAGQELYRCVRDWAERRQTARRVAAIDAE